LPLQPIHCDHNSILRVFYIEGLKSFRLAGTFKRKPPYCSFTNERGLGYRGSLSSCIVKKLNSRILLSSVSIPFVIALRAKPYQHEVISSSRFLSTQTTPHSFPLGSQASSDTIHLKLRALLTHRRRKALTPTPIRRSLALITSLNLLPPALRH